MFFGASGSMLGGMGVTGSRRLAGAYCGIV